MRTKICMELELDGTLRGPAWGTKVFEHDADLHGVWCRGLGRSSEQMEDEIFEDGYHNLNKTLMFEQSWHLWR